MKITMESTDAITSDPTFGVPCRVWRGVTEAGTRCTVLVRGVSVLCSQDQTQFDQELIDQLGEGVEVPLDKVL